MDAACALLRKHQATNEAVEPSFEQIAPVVAAMLHAEGALLDHALDKEYVIADDAAWLRVCMAAAWEVLGRYERAVDRGEWTSS